MIKLKEKNKYKKQKKNRKKDTNIDKKALPFLCYDLVVKAVFMDEVNILAKMISDITGIEYKLLKDNTTLVANEIPISTKNEKAKRCDFVIKVNDGNIISLEVNSSYYPGLLNKNLTYLFGEYVSIIKRSERYSENMYCIQINLNCYKDNLNKVLAKYVLQEVDDYQVYTKSLSIYNLNVAKCNELYYNLAKEEDIPNYVRWGALLYCEDFSKIPEIVKGIMSNDERDKIMDKIYKLTHDDVFMTELEARKIAEWEENSKMNYALEQGVEQGIVQGIEQEKIVTIKKLIEKNMKLEDISDVTGKTIEEIKKIIKEQ